MKQSGIEKLNVYGSSLYVDTHDLARARGMDGKSLIDKHGYEKLAVLAPCEDAITMAANAAEPLLADEDRSRIGLLIVGTESAYDLSKPVSSHLVDLLKLPRTTRHFEVKFACYSGSAALQSALDWIDSGAARGKKALVVNSDFSRRFFHDPTEFLKGCTSSALLISDNPRIMHFERGREGSWCMNVYDTFRPTPAREIIDGSASLFAYAECLQGSYDDYIGKISEPVDFSSFFAYLIYHMPFPRMSYLAHRTLFNRHCPESGHDLDADFAKRVKPSLLYAQHLGSAYGGSVFTGIAGLIDGLKDDLTAGGRVGIYSYGSGAIGQFYSGIICPEATGVVASMRIDESLKLRRKVSMEEYEMIETVKEESLQKKDYTPDFHLPEGWFQHYYRNNRRLVLSQVSDHRRMYEWSR